MEVRTGLSHGLPDPENLGYSGFPRAGKGKLPDRLRGKGRPPLPDLSRKILKKKPSALPGGKALKLCSQTMAHHAAVKGQKAFFGETRGQLLRKGGNTRLPHAVEGDSRPGKLTLRLEKIPAVGPKPRPVGRYGQRPGGSGKIRQKFSGLEIRRRVLRPVIVGGGDQAKIRALPLHRRTKPFKLSFRHNSFPPPQGSCPHHLLCGRWT